jgi:hypothetical protein
MKLEDIGSRVDPEERVGVETHFWREERAIVQSRMERVG